MTQSETTPPYTLGLDIGIASVGACLLLPSKQQILGLHVRAFDKAETADRGESLNLIRRKARLARRRLRRRAHRLQRLRRLLAANGLVADSTPTSLNSVLSPWDLRAEGLTRALQKSEWAQVLYHLVKHRGFQSNRKAERAEGSDTGKMLLAISANKERLESGSFETVGEMAVRHPDFKEAKRNKRHQYTRTIARAEIAAELALLFQRQRELKNSLAAEELEKSVHTLLMERRPVLSGERLLEMVGACTFEPTEQRAPRACYSAERFIWLGKLNNLRIMGLGTSRALDPSERQAIQNLPWERAKVTFEDIRKKLDLDTEAYFNFVRYTGAKVGSNPESKAFFEAKAFHALRKAYKAANLESLWEKDALNVSLLDDLGYALTCFKDDAESREWLRGRGVQPEVIEAALATSFQSFVNLSLKALAKMLPHMAQGLRFDEAALAAGYNHAAPKAAGKRGYLQKPDPKEVRNPVVYRALNQARKLINGIAKRYGPPAAIHIELARDLSKPFSERKEITKAQGEFQKLKEALREDFFSVFSHQPNGLELVKYRLYKEQLGQCPYCKNWLQPEELFAVGYAEVDHVLPYSRSFDDGLNNKVVAHTACNREKGNRTPYEWLDGANDSARWQAFSGWVRSTGGIRKAKQSRLLRVHFGPQESNEFAERNLSDTRYIGRVLKEMVESQLAWHPDAGTSRCVVVSGSLTAFIRTRWGLQKHREHGDKHHGLDAAVVAAADRAMVKRLSDYSRRGELEAIKAGYVDPTTGEVLDLKALRALEAEFPQPWPHFRKELLGWLSDDPSTELAGVPGYDGERLGQLKPVRVSRPVRRRGSGAVHVATVRSIRPDQRSALRVELQDLKPADIPNIVGYGRDTRLIEAIQARLDQFGGNAKKAFAADQPPLRKPSTDMSRAPVIRSVKVFRRSAQKSGIQVRGGIADNGDMLRVDIFKRHDGYFGVPVYVGDSAAEALPLKAAAQGKLEDDWPLMQESNFQFSLYKNDWVRIESRDDVKEGYFASFDRSTASISLWSHDHDQRFGDKGLFRSIGIKGAQLLEKAYVDVLGGLHRADLPESRSSL